MTRNASPADKPLSVRQRRFVDHLLQNHSAAEAARRAGYRPVAAKQTGSRLLKRADIQAALAAGRAEAQAPLTRAAVMAELRAVAFSNLADFMRVYPGQKGGVDLTRISRAQAAGLREMTIEDNWTPGGAHRRVVRLRLGPKTYALSRLLAGLPPDPPEGDGAG